MKTKPSYQELEKEVKELRQKLASKIDGEYYKELIKNNTDAFSVIDENGKNIFQNESNTAILGYTFRERVGKNAFELMIPEDREKLLQQFKILKKEKGVTQKINFQAYHKDGTLRHLEGTAKNMLHSPLIKGVIINYRDVTKRKKAEQTIQKTLQQIELINVNVPNISWKVTVNSKGEFVNAFVSETVDEFLNLPPNTINNDWDKYFNYVDPAYLDEIKNIIQQGIENPQMILSFDYEVIKGNNERAWFSTKGKAVIEDNIITLYGSTIDITEQKKIELLLKESENRFKSLSEATYEAIFISEKGVCIEANEAAGKKFGYTHDEMIGMFGTDFIAPISKEVVKNNMLSGYEKPYDAIALKKNGEEFYAEFNGRMFEYKGKKVRITAVRDISERKKTEQALKESEAKYRNIIENMSDIYYRTDAEGKLVLGSNSIVKIFGYSEPVSELIGSRIESIYKDPNERTNFLESLKKNGKIENYRTTLLKQDGSEIFVETTSKMLLNKKGEFAGVEGIVRDITERKKSEQTLLESKEKYKLLLNQFRLMSDNIPDLVWAKDLDGNFTFVNKAVCDKLLIAKDTNEPIGKNDFFFVKRQRDLYPDRDDWHTFGEICINSDEVVLKNKKPQRFDEFGNVNGKFLFLDVYKAPIFDDTGKIIGTVGHGRIVTKEKEDEQKLQAQNKEYELLNKKYILQNQELEIAKAKAEESNRLKSAFLANMSHEIRTPMNAIIGFAGFLRNEEVEVEKRNYFLDIINNSGNHLLNLINDIIDISKIDAKQMTLIETECKLNEFLFEIHQFFLSDITRKKDKLKLLLTKELTTGEDVIKTDTTRLRQILINLIGNAIKFTSSGTVEIKYTIINNEKIQFSIKDTGIGISKKELPIIFKRFRQADETATRKYGGTGLGLAISEACTKLLGGDIWVESEYRIGSTFYFTIPYKPIKAAKSRAVISVEKRKNIFKGKTILIVEDDLYSCMILEEVLKPTNAHLLKAKDGLKAIEICEKNPQIDIVLMDLQLPKLNGLKATEEIKRMRPHLPIISQTANAMYNDQQKSLDAGCVDHITKPINTKELIEKVAKQII